MIREISETTLRELADDAFVVMNWARREGMNKDRQIEQVVLAFKKTLSMRRDLQDEVFDVTQGGTV